MPHIKLPFLTVSKRGLTRGGRPRFGWSAIEAEVPEAAPEEFRTAICQTLAYNTSMSTYAGRGAFWRSVMYPARPVFSNFEGILQEAVFKPTEKADEWRHTVSESLHTRGILAKAKAAGVPVRRDHDGSPTVTAVLGNDDGPEEDRQAFSSWCSANLVLVEGRLMTRVHAPSVCLTWIANHRSLGAYCGVTTRHDYPATYGGQGFWPGLHFELTGDGLSRHLAEAADVLKGGNAVRSELSHHVHWTRRLEGMLAERGLSGKRKVFDLAVIDEEVYRSVPDAIEDMGERSLVAMGEALARTTNPSAHRPGPKKDALVEIARLSAVGYGDRDDGFHESLANALASLPTEDEPARAWFIEKVLDMWDRASICVWPQTSHAVSGP